MKESNYSTYEVVAVARQKLCGDKVFDPADTKHMLAILGQRFGLEICLGHPEAVKHVECGVASHLRICLATTENRTWSFTSYPSEPFLSCIAASILHGSTDTLQTCLRSLQKKIYSGMISTGQAGELASRMIWLLAKDFFIRTQGKGLFFASPPIPDWSATLNDCMAIPLMGYLEHVFGKRAWPSEALKAFGNAYINFSHWLDMEKSIGKKHKDRKGKDRQDKDGVRYDLLVDSRLSRTLMNASSEIWTRRHWQRTSALQCCHNQHAVDKMIPIYFKPEDGSSAPGRVSQIFISHKAQSGKNKSHLRDISRVDSTIDCASSDAYVAILVDLGTSDDDEFEASWQKIDTNDAYSLRIYAGGINATTFPFLTCHPYIIETLRHIVSPPKLPAQEGLRDKVKFGSTRTKSHLFWEIGNEKALREVNALKISAIGTDLVGTVFQ